jgi:hypothetical protein
VPPRIKRLKHEYDMPRCRKGHFFALVGGKGHFSKDMYTCHPTRRAAQIGRVRLCKRYGDKNVRARIGQSYGPKRAAVKSVMPSIRCQNVRLPR